MSNLGLLYLRGLGVPQDYVLGYLWANLAAAGGLKGAAALRNVISARMTAQQIAESEWLAGRLRTDLSTHSDHMPEAERVP